MMDLLSTATDAVMAGVFATMGMVGLGPDEPQPFVMDEFLSGFETRCAISEPLYALWRSMAQGEALALPEGHGDDFGTPMVAHHDDYSEIRLPVDGVWRGHEVSHVLVVAGRDNGISLIGVLFAPDQTHLEAEFAPIAASARQVLAEDPENITGMTADFVTYDGHPHFFCDLST